MSQFAEEKVLVEGCLAGDESAWGRLQEHYRVPLVGLLRSRGASDSEAEDLIAELWADLLGAPPLKPPLLTRFRGVGSLRTWLGTIVLNRLVSLRRKTSRLVNMETEAVSEIADTSQTNPVDADFVQQMHSSLIRAWRNCAPDFRVMLQLIHVERLKQRDVAKVWGWSESKVSRALDAAMSQIREDTLRGISDYDHGEVLVWQDFIDLGNLCGEFLE